MSFKFTKNIKVAQPVLGGELVFEFKRPTNEEKNAFLHEQLDIKSEGKEHSNAVDGIRVAVYDQFIEAVYVETNEGKRDAIVDEDDKPKGPKDFPPDVKVKAVVRAFEMAGIYSKNI